MNNVETLLLALASAALVFAAVALIIPALRKRGFDPEAALTNANKTIASLTGALSLARPFLAESEGLKKIDTAIEVAKVGVRNAEQLCLLEKLPPEERNGYAKRYAADTLRSIGFEVTPEMQAVIDGAIEAEVMTLGHKVK